MGGFVVGLEWWFCGWVRQWSLWCLGQNGLRTGERKEGEK